MCIFLFSISPLPPLPLPLSPPLSPSLPLSPPPLSPSLPLSLSLSSPLSPSLSPSPPPSPFFPSLKAFCLEEVLIADRWNRQIYNKYGDILYSNGTKEDLLLSRKYYSYSISISSKGENVRALYGLCLVC